VSGEFKRRADYDENVMAAFREGRQADDIYVVYCSACFAWSYWNQGSHCNCRFCLADLDDDEAITMADYWDDAIYPCDEGRASVAKPNES
jgi:hypothetical protein